MAFLSEPRASIRENIQHNNVPVPPLTQLLTRRAELGNCPGHISRDIVAACTRDFAYVRHAGPRLCASRHRRGSSTPDFSSMQKRS